MNKNIKIIILLIILFFMIQRKYKEGFSNLTTVNNSYKATQNQIKGLFNNDNKDYTVLNKHIHAPKGINTLNNTLYSKDARIKQISAHDGELKLKSYPVHIDGGINSWGGNYKFGHTTLPREGRELCLEGVCINANHLRVLRGERGFSIKSNRGSTLSDNQRCAGKGKDQHCQLPQFLDNNNGDWEKMHIQNIR